MIQSKLSNFFCFFLFTKRRVFFFAKEKQKTFTNKELC